MYTQRQIWTNIHTVVGVASVVHCLYGVYRHMHERQYSTTPCSGPCSCQCISEEGEELVMLAPPVSGAHIEEGMYLFTAVQSCTRRSNTFPEALVRHFLRRCVGYTGKASTACDITHHYHFLHSSDGNLTTNLLHHASLLLRGAIVHSATAAATEPTRVAAHLYT